MSELRQIPVELGNERRIAAIEPATEPLLDRIAKIRKTSQLAEAILMSTDYAVKQLCPKLGMDPALYNGSVTDLFRLAIDQVTEMWEEVQAENEDEDVK